MKHVMLDIETLGNKPGAVILSISAVQFDIESGLVGSEFEIFIDPRADGGSALKMNEDTVLWWLSQNKEAQDSLLEGVDKGVGLKTALMDFNSWLVHTFNGKDFHIWGNSNRFDMGILAWAMDSEGIAYGWNHRNELDVRTLVWMSPSFKANEEFTGIKHNGIADCNHQIKYCCRTYNAVMSLNKVDEAETTG